MKQQVVVIHGGSAFKDRKKYLKYLATKPVDKSYFNPSRAWSRSLQQALGSKFEVLLPQMPNKTNARYDEWEIWFKRMFLFLNNNVILIGHSLGGIFLAKYLSENKFPKKVKALVLLAAPYNTKRRHPYVDFNLSEKFSKLTSQTKQIYIIHSMDDRVVSYKEALEYKEALPNAELITFKNRRHFNQETFPEIVELIKSLK